MDIGFSRRSLVIGGLLSLAAAAAHARGASRWLNLMGDMKLAELVPRSVGAWSREPSDEVVTPTEGWIRGVYDQQLSAVYLAADRPPVMLLIAYGATQSDAIQVHRPEGCYPAAGFVVDEPRALTLALTERALPASAFTARRHHRVEHVLYWTRIGNEFPTDWISQRFARFKSELRGASPDGMLVRFSTIGSDFGSSVGFLVRFAEAFMDAVPADARRVFLGNLGER